MKFRAYSDINWGRFYDPTTGAHHCEADSAEQAATILPTHAARGFSSMQVNVGGIWRWVTETPSSIGGIRKD